MLDITCVCTCIWKLLYYLNICSHDLFDQIRKINMPVSSLYYFDKTHSDEGHFCQGYSICQCPDPAIGWRYEKPRNLHPPSLVNCWDYPADSLCLTHEASLVQNKDRPWSSAVHKLRRKQGRLEEAKRDFPCVIMQDRVSEPAFFLLRYLVFGVSLVVADPAHRRFIRKKLKSISKFGIFQAIQMTGPVGTLCHVNLGYIVANCQNPPSRPMSPSCESQCPSIRGRVARKICLISHEVNGKSQKFSACGWTLPTSNRAGRSMYYQILSSYDRAT